MSESQKESTTPAIDAQDVVTNPEKYGFKWKYGKLHRGTGSPKKLLREAAPYIELIAEELAILAFVRAFGPAKITSMTSLHVKVQATTRPAIEANNAVSNDALKLRIVNHVLLGKVTRGVVTHATLYPMPDGTTTKDQSVARAAWKASATSHAPSDADKAREMIEMLVDAGVDPQTAIAKARAKYPSVAPIVVGEDAPDDEIEEDSENNES